MASNIQKIPVTASLAAMGIKTASNQSQRQGRCYPCTVAAVNGAIITVNYEVQSTIFTFPQTQMPLFGPEYIRYPIQVGDKGMAVSADIFLGGMSGLGTGTATLSEIPNLGGLVFLPIGNANWSTVDPNATTLYGPNGVVLRDSDSKVTITLTPSGVTINMNSNGNVSILNGDLHVQGDVIAGYGGGDSVTLQNHRHGTGTAAAGTVVPTAGT